MLVNIQHKSATQQVLRIVVVPGSKAL